MIARRSYQRTALAVALFLAAALSGAAQTLVTTVIAGSQPVAVAVNATTNKIYVVNRASNSVTVIDGSTNHATRVTVGGIPVAVAVNATTNKIYVANEDSDTVTCKAAGCVSNLSLHRI